MKGVTVAVTGMNAKPDNPGPGLAVARCLRESEGFEGRIVGLGYDVLDPGLYLREQCDAGYLLPYPSAGEAALLERLRAIQARESIDILIPCLDAELLGFARLMPELEQMGIRCLLPDVEQLQQRNKDRLGDLAASAGTRLSADETRDPCWLLLSVPARGVALPTGGQGPVLRCAGGPQSGSGGSRLPPYRQRVGAAGAGAAVRPG